MVIGRSGLVELERPAVRDAVPAEPAPEPETAEEPAPAGDETAEAASDPEEPKERLVSLEDVMDRTVSAVMEEESAQRQMEMAQEEAAARKAKRAALPGTPGGLQVLFPEADGG